MFDMKPIVKRYCCNLHPHNKMVFMCCFLPVSWKECRMESQGALVMCHPQ